MMRRHAVVVAGSLALMVAGAVQVARAAEPQPAPRRAKADAGARADVKRGEYLVTIAGCHDCHTPMKPGPKGAEPDMSRMLSGHPEQLEMPPAPKLSPGPWLMTVAGTNTAWAGPWGVSFTANLTPDKETGLGTWTEEVFIETLRTGRHLGRGRPILPPMPWPMYAKMTDADLKAVFAYLRTIPPLKNRVPAPRPPEGTAAAGAP